LAMGAESMGTEAMPYSACSCGPLLTPAAGVPGPILAIGATFPTGLAPAALLDDASPEDPQAASQKVASRAADADMNFARLRGELMYFLIRCSSREE